MSNRIALTIAVALVAATTEEEGKTWWSHVQFLADDDLQGRNVGARLEDVA